MSKIKLIEVKDRGITVANKDYKEVIQMLNQSSELSEEREDLECGYLFLDRNQKLLVSNQFGFSLKHLDEQVLKDLKKKWNVLEF